MPEGLLLRDFDRSDQSRVRRLILNGLSEHWGEIDKSLNADLDDIAVTYASGRTVVAELNQELVGTGTLVPRTQTVAEIVRMSVAPSLRRSGVGRTLVDELIRTARAWSLTSVVVETSSIWTDVVAFYVACGFEVTGERNGDFAPRRWSRLVGVSERGTEVEVLLAAPLTFEVPSEFLHCPMVMATFGETTTKLIVDCGATDHVLTIDLANRSHLAYDAGAPGTDIAGASVASWSIGDVTAAVFSGTSIALTDVVAIEGPEPFKEWGVGGFLSPQRLWPDATVVLDLIADSLLVLDGADDAIRDHLRIRYEGCAVLDVVRQSAGTLGVLASVVPFDPVVALLDSGAATTEFADAAAPGLLGAIGESGRGVSGESIIATEVPDQLVAFGDGRRRLSALYIRPAIPAPEGAAPGEVPQALLGMDCMRSTALTIGPKATGDVRWFVGDLDRIRG